MELKQSGTHGLHEQEHEVHVTGGKATFPLSGQTQLNLAYGRAVWRGPPPSGLPFHCGRRTDQDSHKEHYSS